MTEQMHHKSEAQPLPKKRTQSKPSISFEKDLSFSRVSETGLPFTPSTKEKVLDAILNHNPDATSPKLTIAVIAANVGVTPQRVSRIIKDEEEKRGKMLIARTNSPHTPEQNREGRKYVGELSAQGFPAEEIMELTGRGKTFVERILAKMRKAGKEEAKNKRDQQVADLRKKGYGNSAIGKELSLPRGTVDFILKRFRNNNPDLFRIRKKRRSKEEMEKYYQKVSELRNMGLGRLEIAKQLRTKGQSLQDSRFAVDAALSRKRMQDAKENVVFEAPPPPINA